MEKKKINKLELEIATIEVMIVSLYNTTCDIIKAISSKAKIDGYEKWLHDCQGTASKLLEERESDK